MALADRIKETRENRGMSMTDLAGIVKVSTSAVSTWEAGRSTPRPAMLTKVAKALGVTANYLLETESEDWDEHDGVEEILSRAKQDLALAMSCEPERLKLELSFTA